MIVFPNAKINLGLHVVERRTDGYHNIETAFYPVGINDALDVVESSEFRIDVTGIAPEGQPEENLVAQAYRFLKKDFSLPPVHIHLHKKIPSGAGLGGGSSDAAFMLKLLNQLFSLSLTHKKLQKYASRLGADCTFFIQNKPLLAKGIGDILTPVNLILEDYRVLVIKPPFSINTSEAYRNIIPKKPSESLSDILKQPVKEWHKNLINDFEKPVFSIYPELSNIKNTLYEQGADYASMSGSGSAVYGLFRNLPVISADSLPNGCLIYR